MKNLTQLILASTALLPVGGLLEISSLLEIGYFLEISSFLEMSKLDVVAPVSTQNRTPTGGSPYRQLFATLDQLTQRRFGRALEAALT